MKFLVGELEKIYFIEGKVGEDICLLFLIFDRIGKKEKCFFGEFLILNMNLL